MSGLILILLWAGLNALIASRRGRSGLAFFAASVLPVIPLIVLAARSSAGDDTITGWSAFAAPALAFVAALGVRSGAETAARTGDHGGYARCPYCAEPVRREAIRCRYCASDLPDLDEAA